MFFKQTPVSFVSLCERGRPVLLCLLIAMRPVRVSFRCTDVCPNDSKQRRPFLSASRTHTEAFVRREGLRITHLFASLTLFLSFFHFYKALSCFLFVPDVQRVIHNNPWAKLILMLANTTNYKAAVVNYLFMMFLQFLFN